MRLNLLLPVLEPGKLEKPERCPHGCGGTRFVPYQAVRKPVRDMKYRGVQAWRYRCLRCQRTFRVYPRGVKAAWVSQQVKGLAVMLYLLGLSYGAVALVLRQLGVEYGKTSVYRCVQEAARRAPNA